MPKLFDVHAHAQFAAYENDYKEVIDRALKNDVWLIDVGTQRDTSKKAVEIAESYKEGVYATVGLHPIHTEKSYHDSQELGPPSDSASVATSVKEAALAKDGGEPSGFTSRGEEFDHAYYKNLGEHPKVVAVGECGLDYYRLEEITKSRQADIFNYQIDLSKELGKPLMIHCRQAFADLIGILESRKNDLLDPPGMVHFFTGTKDDAAKLMNLGFSFSFGGVITFARDYDEALKFVPVSNILLETDAPYVSPSPFRGKRNEPSYVIETARRVAELKNLSLDEISKLTTANARRIFKV